MLQSRLDCFFFFFFVFLDYQFCSFWIVFDFGSNWFLCCFLFVFVLYILCIFLLIEGKTSKRTWIIKNSAFTCCWERKREKERRQREERERERARAYLWVVSLFSVCSPDPVVACCCCCCLHHRLDCCRCCCCCCCYRCRDCCRRSAHCYCRTIPRWHAAVPRPQH